ncbi:MAG: XRE family transcriptional regulator [Arenicellales bacterium]
MTTKHQKLIELIIETAKSQGLDQKDLAARVSMTAPDLSRLKSADNSRFSTIENLANAVGLKLALVPDDELLEKIESGKLFS